MYIQKPLSDNSPNYSEMINGLRSFSAWGSVIITVLIWIWISVLFLSNIYLDFFSVNLHMQTYPLPSSKFSCDWLKHTHKLSPSPSLVWCSKRHRKDLAIHAHERRIQTLISFSFLTHTELYGGSKGRKMLHYIPSSCDLLPINHLCRKTENQQKDRTSWIFSLPLYQILLQLDLKADLLCSTDVGEIRAHYNRALFYFRLLVWNRNLPAAGRWSFLQDLKQQPLTLI